jgi:hypothetical protein
LNCRKNKGVNSSRRSLTPSPFSAMLAGMVYPGGKNGAGVYQTIINLDAAA